MKGENNLNSKYSLWDISYVHYHKGSMFKKNRKANPRRCFLYKYDGYQLPIGLFHDFLTPQIINDLVSDALDE